MIMMKFQLYIVLVVAHHCVQQPSCHALAQSFRGNKAIVSRKGDGRYVTYSLEQEDRDETSGGGTGSSKSLERGKKQLFFNPSATTTTTLQRLQSALRSTFLPALPSNRSVATLRKSGYLNYIFYDNIQDLSTSLRSVLATQRILEGVGVGRAGATALSATLNFLVRDGCGMIASLLFTSYAARSFRRNVKRWRFFADIMVDIGITLEIIAPSFLAYPSLCKWFLPLLCLGNVCKALCGVAAGACGGALQMYWSVKLMGTEEGISEVAAKSGAQRTVMGALGLVLAAITANWLGSGDVKTAIGIYFALTAVHLFANYRSLQLIALDWLNGWRLHRVVEEFLDINNEGRIVDGKKLSDKSIVHVSNPMEASSKEPLLFLPEWRAIKTKYPIRMGVSYNEIAQMAPRRHLSFIQSYLATKQRVGNKEDNYILAVGPKGGGRCILVAFFSNSSNDEKAKAYLHGCLVRRALIKQFDECRSTTIHLEDGSEDEAICKAEEEAERQLSQLWPIFKEITANAGWNLSKTECLTEGYEMHFE